MVVQSEKVKLGKMLGDLLHQGGVGIHRRKLRKLLADVVRSMKENAVVRAGKHGNVIVGVPSGNHLVLKGLKCLHRTPFLVCLS